MAIDGLHGRIALVTGGSRGIGAAISRALAEAGAGVAINYRERSDHAKSLADELLDNGVRAISVQADVSQPDALEGPTAFLQKRQPKWTGRVSEITA